LAARKQAIDADAFLSVFWKYFQLILTVLLISNFNGFQKFKFFNGFQKFKFFNGFHKNSKFNGFQKFNFLTVFKKLVNYSHISQSH